MTTLLTNKACAQLISAVLNRDIESFNDAMTKLPEMCNLDIVVDMAASKNNIYMLNALHDRYKQLNKPFPKRALYVAYRNKDVVNYYKDVVGNLDTSNILLHSLTDGQAIMFIELADSYPELLTEEVLKDCMILAISLERTIIANYIFNLYKKTFGKNFDVNFMIKLSSFALNRLESSSNLILEKLSLVYGLSRDTFVLNKDVIYITEELNRIHSILPNNVIFTEENKYRYYNDAKEIGFYQAVNYMERHKLITK